MPDSLAPGDSHITEPFATTTKNGTPTFRARYSVRTPGGQLVRNSAFGPTASAAKDAARLKIKAILQTGATGTWKPSDKLLKFITDVSVKVIADAHLRPKTEERYLSVIKIITGKCGCYSRDHANLSRYTIANGLTHDVLAGLLQQVADVHGSENAHHCLSVLRKYVVKPARSRALIMIDPLEGFSARTLQGRYRGQGAQRDTDAVLSESDYWRVVDYLLTRDDAPLPANVPNKGKHAYVRKPSRQRAANARDQLLIAAGTGLRAAEIAAQHVAGVIDAKGQVIRSGLIERDDRLYAAVSKTDSKTKKQRIVPVLDEIADHVRDLIEDAPEDAYVVGSPADRSLRWHQSGRDRAAAALFREIADKLDLDILEADFRSHGFRHTLSSIWAARGVGVEVRARWFGHTVAVNQSIYTDLDSLDQVAAAMRRVDKGQHLAAV